MENLLKVKTILIPACCNPDTALPLLENCNKVHFSFVFLNSKQEAIMQYLNDGLSWDHEVKKGKGCRNCVRGQGMEKTAGYSKQRSAFRLRPGMGKKSCYLPVYICVHFAVSTRQGLHVQGEAKLSEAIYHGLLSSLLSLPQMGFIKQLQQLHLKWPRPMWGWLREAFPIPQPRVYWATSENQPSWNFPFQPSPRVPG